MNNNDVLLRVKIKINNLLDKHQEIVKENGALKKRNEILEKEVEEFRNEIGYLKRQLSTKELANSLVNKNDDPKLLKQRINVLLKEIDKCIAYIDKVE